jgi:hypothetical protein
MNYIWEHLDIIAIFSQIIGFVVWLARLEMRVKMLQELHEDCQKRRMIFDDESLKRLENIEKSLVKIETDIQWIKKDRQAYDSND